MEYRSLAMLLPSMALSIVRRRPFDVKSDGSDAYTFSIARDSFEDEGRRALAFLPGLLFAENSERLSFSPTGLPFVTLRPGQKRNL